MRALALPLCAFALFIALTGCNRDQVAPPDTGPALTDAADVTRDAVNDTVTDTVIVDSGEDAADTAVLADASDDTVDAANDVAVDAPNCDGGANHCYACPPSTLTQYLNQCTSSSCAPFDNEARLPLYNHGALPPLP